MLRWAEIRQPPGWHDDVCLVCHMGHKSRYGMMGCSECWDDIIYEALPYHPNNFRPAMDWMTARVMKDPRPTNPLHERRGGRQRTRAAMIHNSDRTQARWRDNGKIGTSEGALLRYHAAMAGKAATLSAERS
eukprot:9306927-Pyramimonas_sp.AAC.1